MARSLNRVQLIGNMTRDPELRYTPNGTAVCSFGLATGRSWTTDTGEKREETDFHRIVAWNKLAELCSQYLAKGRKVYVEGRLSTRNWTAKDGSQKTTTEVVIDDMIILDSRRPVTEGAGTEEKAEEKVAQTPAEKPAVDSKRKTSEKKSPEEPAKTESASEEEVAPEDIPF